MHDGKGIRFYKRDIGLYKEKAARIRESLQYFKGGDYKHLEGNEDRIRELEELLNHHNLPGEDEIRELGELLARLDSIISYVEEHPDSE